MTRSHHPRRVRERGLNAKQLAFCAHYAKTRQPAQSVIDAGYVCREPSKAAHDLLRNPLVVAEIKRIVGPVIREFEITAQKVLQEIAGCAFVSIDQIIDIDPDTGQASINLAKADLATLKGIGEITTKRTRLPGGEGQDDGEIVETKVKMVNKLDALDKLARWLKLLGHTDKDADELPTIRFVIEHSAPDTSRPAPLDVTPRRLEAGDQG